jgi:hypothetical protein
MTAVLSPQVETRAAAAGFEPVVAALRHPNGRTYAVTYWLWAIILGVYPVLTVVLLIAGQMENAQWAVVVVADLVAAAVAVLLASRALGSVRRRAFYLYPQGYIATGASGRVTHVKRWEEVSRIEGAGPGVNLVAMGRVMCRIHHHDGRPIKFSEFLNNGVLAPTAYQLHAEATQKAR